MLKKIFTIAAIFFIALGTFKTQAYNLLESDMVVVYNVTNVILERAETKWQDWLDQIIEAIPTVADRVREKQPRVARILVEIQGVLNERDSWIHPIRAFDIPNN